MVPLPFVLVNLILEREIIQAKARYRRAQLLSLSMHTQKDHAPPRVPEPRQEAQSVRASNGGADLADEADDDTFARFWQATSASKRDFGGHCHLFPSFIPSIPLRLCCVETEGFFCSSKTLAINDSDVCSLKSLTDPHAGRGSQTNLLPRPQAGIKARRLPSKNKTGITDHNSLFIYPLPA